MSTEDFEAARGLIGDHPDRCDFVGPRDPEVVWAAESALGLTLPPTYRRFVEESGAGGAGSREFYGVISEPFTGPIPCRA